MKLGNINNLLIFLVLAILLKIIYDILYNNKNIETFYNWKYS